jgi:hypothetical protein
MKKFSFFFVIAVFLCITVGCGSVEVGKHFDYYNKVQLVLGKTTLDDAYRLFGEPYGSGTKISSNKQFEILKYQYVYGKLIGGQDISDLLWLEFENDVLNAYISLDKSNYTDATKELVINKSAKIKSKISTKDDVLSIIGKPYGKAFCQSTFTEYETDCFDEQEIWLWNYISKSSINSTLLILFDKNGIVSKIEISNEELN